MSDTWIELGARVEGTYLGKNITGTVKNVTSSQKAGQKVFQVILDEAIDVVKSENFSSMRKNLTLTLDIDGPSVNTKGIRDDIAFIQATA